MRLAQLVPPASTRLDHAYSIAELVGWLAEDHAAAGHEVTVFCDEAFPRPGGCSVRPLDDVFPVRREFDLIHSHFELLDLRFDPRQDPPFLTTFHDPMDPRRLRAAYLEARDHAFVSVSYAQRAAFPFLEWRATIPPGLPAERFRLCETEGGYLACVGPVAPASGFHLAIDIARSAEVPLRLVALPGPVDTDYFDAEIRPQLCQASIHFEGALRPDARAVLLAGAFALLCPIDAPAPFNVVAIEALAVGTPVIVCGHGAVAEVIDDGATGFRVGSVDKASEAVASVGELSRKRCRKLFDQQLSAGNMSREYESLYRWLVSERRRG